MVPLLVVGFALGACGGDSEEDAVREAVEEFVAAVRDGDGAAACELLTDEALETAGGARCERALGRIGDAVAPEVEITDIRVQGDRATAEAGAAGGGEDEVRSQPLDFVKEDDEWKIASFGG